MFFRPSAIVLLTLLVLTATGARAQHWMTKEACAVRDPKIDHSLTNFDRVAEQAAKITNGTGRLWRVTSPNGAVSHLWGTLHSTNPLILDLPDELREVLAKAKVVAPEFDPVFKNRRRMEIVAQGSDLWRDLYYPDELLKFDSRVQPWIESRLISLGYGAEAAGFLKAPALAEILLADPCDDFSWGALPIQDDRVLLLALDAGAEIAGLEDRFAFRRALSKADMAETLDAVIQVYGTYLDPARFQATRNTSFAFYLQGRIAEMIAMERINMAEFFGLEKGNRFLQLVDDYMLYERNLDFVTAAKPLLDAGGAVISVGCFHLPGENGLVALFRSEGLLVERVFVKGEVALR
ncbi:MAG: TraB/GumN family protein [Rhodobacteraceae bacterium]|nr:TraB/GumN family protein [Paracoccaceae bacterium]